MMEDQRLVGLRLGIMVRAYSDKPFYQIADELKIHPAAMSCYLNGTRGVPLHVAVTLAKHLGFSLEAMKGLTVVQVFGENPGGRIDDGGANDKSRKAPLDG